jgi:hypothetical protein
VRNGKNFDDILKLEGQHILYVKSKDRVQKIDDRNHGNDGKYISDEKRN